MIQKLHRIAGVFQPITCNMLIVSMCIKMKSCVYEECEKCIRKVPDDQLSLSEEDFHIVYHHWVSHVEDRIGRKGKLLKSVAQPGVAGGL